MNTAFRSTWMILLLSLLEAGCGQPAANVLPQTQAQNVVPSEPAQLDDTPLIDIELCSYLWDGYLGPFVTSGLEQAKDKLAKVKIPASYPVKVDEDLQLKLGNITLTINPKDASKNILVNNLKLSGLSYSDNAFSDCQSAQLSFGIEGGAQLVVPYELQESKGKTSGTITLNLPKSVPINATVTTNINLDDIENPKIVVSQVKTNIPQVFQVFNLGKDASITGGNLPNAWKFATNIGGDFIKDYLTGELNGILTDIFKNFEIEAAFFPGATCSEEDCIGILVVTLKPILGLGEQTFTIENIPMPHAPGA